MSLMHPAPHLLRSTAPTRRMADATQSAHTVDVRELPTHPAPGRPGATGRDVSVTGKATAFAPASVGNIGVGFDLLGHTITGLGDRAQVTRIAEPLVRITAIEGDVEGASQLPLEAAANTAGRALIELRERRGIAHGFELRLHKGIPLGSGLGGSAASCVAALLAANAVLDAPLTRDELYPLALVGEAVASGSVHGDNVAPMLFGGVVLATATRAIPLAAPELYCAAVHPHFVLETRKARAALAEPYAIGEFVQQSEYLALFLTGLARGDRDLIAAGLHDGLVEPRRAALIPGFAEVKAAALAHGALGASISGAGPTVFGWFDNADEASWAAHAMQVAFAGAGLDSDVYVSPVNGPRAEVVGE